MLRKYREAKGNQEGENTPTIAKTQKPKHQDINTINKSQDNIIPLEPSNLTKVRPENCRIVEAQDKDFKLL